MINKEKYYSVSAEIARLSGVIGSRYRTKDGRFILSDRDLKKAISKMMPEEFIGGIDAIALTERQSKKLIVENKYQMGEQYIITTPEAEQTETVAEEEQSEAVETSESTTEQEQEETTNETEE